MKKKDTIKKEQTLHTFDEMKMKPVKAGVIIDGVFHRKVKNEHYMVKEYGYGIQKDVMQTLVRKNIEYIVLHAVNTILKSKVSDWISRGYLKDYGAGFQIFLSTEAMTPTKKK